MSAAPENDILSPEDAAAFSTIEQQQFGFRHGLNRSPLLQLAALRELAGYMQQKGLSYFFQTSSNQKSGWGDQPGNMSLLDSFGELEGGNVLIILKSVHRHPDYARIMDAFLLRLSDMLRVDVARTYSRPICTIILASPRRITPYHVDDSHNLLLQVLGHKAFYVYDGRDADIVTDEELDAFWNGDVNAARLTDAKQAKATRYDLGPGSGVHVPLLYPHRAENGDDVSVAVSMNFQSRRDTKLKVLSFNNFLRTRGFHPRPPGHSRLVDTSKLVAFTTLGALKQLTRPSA